MAEDERPTPSIAPPSIAPPSLRRRKRKDASPEPTPAPAPTAVPASDDTAPIAPVEPVAEPSPEPAPEPTEVLPAATPAAAPVRKAPKTKAPKVAKAPKAPKAAKAPRTKAAKAPKAPKPPRAPRRLPALDPRVAAGVSGLLTGLLMVGLTVGALRGCEAVRGTSTCGGTAGTLLLLVIVIAGAWVGSLLTSALRVPGSGGTGLLGVALVCVLCLLFLTGALEAAWMIVGFPLLTAACFLVAYALSAAVDTEA